MAVGLGVAVGIGVAVGRGVSVGVAGRKGVGVGVGKEPEPGVMAGEAVPAGVSVFGLSSGVGKGVSCTLGVRVLKATGVMIWNSVGSGVGSSDRLLQPAKANSKIARDTKPTVFLRLKSIMNLGHYPIK